MTVLATTDPAYPRLLATIKNPPNPLYVKGDPEVLSRPMLAVIGTRQASSDGLLLARYIGYKFAKLGYVIVSGLAEDIDTAAHQGALEAGAVTVAVMAHGLHMIYPASNYELAAQIVRLGGALVSEHASGVGPTRAAFPLRNRIQSGLSDATIMVESDVRGGSMHTCRHAQEQGRLLFAVLPPLAFPNAPHRPLFPTLNRAGAERAVHEFGAVPVSNLGDIEHALASRPSTQLPLTK